MPLGLCNRLQSHSFCKGIIPAQLKQMQRIGIPQRKLAHAFECIVLNLNDSAQELNSPFLHKKIYI